MDAGLLAQYVMNGLMLGMMYALVAVGFTLFFGVLDVIKFSHGDVLTVGAFTALAAFIGLQRLGIASDALGAGAQHAVDHADARHRAARGGAPVLSRRSQSEAVSPPAADRVGQP